MMTPISRDIQPRSEMDYRLRIRDFSVIRDHLWVIRNRIWSYAKPSGSTLILCGPETVI